MNGHIRAATRNFEAKFDASREACGDGFGTQNGQKNAGNQSPAAYNCGRLRLLCEDGQTRHQVTGRGERLQVGAKEKSISFNPRPGNKKWNRKGEDTHVLSGWDTRVLSEKKKEGMPHAVGLRLGAQHKGGRGREEKSVPGRISITARRWL